MGGRYRCGTIGMIEIDALDRVRVGSITRDQAEYAAIETRVFKADVRKLKNLGLTISCEVGYEISPRGRAFLRRSG
ncbi:MAG: hypothetical protein VCE43_03450 [Myxococcota bacterium]